MVISNNPEGETPTMYSERSKPLHNFSLPSLKWGNQRLLRCFKEESSTTGSPDHRSSASEPEFEKETRRSPPTADGYFKKRDKPKMENTKPSYDGIEQVREKLLIHLKTAVKNVDKMKFPIVPEKDEEEQPRPVVVVVPPSVAPPTAAKPWNLRTRRAACKAPNESGGGKSLKLDQNQHHQHHNHHQQQQQRNSSSPQPNPSPKSFRLRGMAANQGLEKEKEKEKKKQKKRREFLPVLTSDEIKEDFLFMTGGKPPRRPKKRPRIVQKQIDTLYPCFWLTEVTPDSYKVPDEPETR